MDLSYLREWLDAFELLRARGGELLDAFSLRITKELGGDAPPVAPPKAALAESGVEGRASLLRRCTSALRLLRNAWTQHRLLQARYPSAANAPSTALVAMSSRRLPLPIGQSPRARLEMLARAMPGATDPERIGRALADAEVILMFEPFKTALWDEPERFWDEGVFLVDYAFVALVLLLSPRHTARVLIEQRAALRAEWRNGSQRFKSALVALLLTAGYYRLMANVSSPCAYFFTSNSFASETLRVMLLRMPRCRRICEVLHGIPTEEFEEYLETMLGFADDVQKHVFVQQLPAFPSYGVVANSVGDEPGFAINTAVNRYFGDRAALVCDVARWIEMECGKLKVKKAGHNVSVLTLIGATGTERDYLTSRAFQAELAILERAAAVLATANRPFVVCYAPHPAHPVTMFESVAFFRQKGVVICPDMVLMWLVADACIGLYSSALFEAEYVGAEVFTPLRSDDGLYRSGVLERLSHPGDRESWLDALGTFLESCRHLPGEPLPARAARRVQRLVDLTVSRPSAVAACT